MFENDDWNIDEDYLKDFNADDIINNFQIGKPEERQISNSSKYFEEKERHDKSCISENTSTNIGSQHIDATSRKNTVLDIFKNTPSRSKNSKCSEYVSTSNSLIQQSQKKPTSISNESRRNLVLSVFQKNEISVKKNDVNINKPPVKSVLKVTEIISENENRLKRKKCVAFSETNVSKKVCISNISESPNENINSNLPQNNELSDSVKESVLSKSNVNNYRNKLLDFVRCPVQKEIRASRMRQTVTRKFPGPAGLLPDDVDECEIINLDALDENKNNKRNECSTVCSQNTKNLFTTGAWQLMMDDLPADFPLCDIATVKENALEYSKMYKKVPYLAGIIHYIDYKPNDPHVILKDFSGKINAQIHHSISKLYPNALGTSVVLLVKDVGLIVTSKKYVCIIISPKNLVSIYCDDARLVETVHLQNLLDKNVNSNLCESQISVLDEADSEMITDNVEFSANSAHKVDSKFNNKVNLNSLLINAPKKDKEPVSSDKFINQKPITEEQAQISSNNDDIQDFDFDDSWLQVNIDSINSFSCSEFPTSTPANITNENVNNKTNKNISPIQETINTLNIKSSNSKETDVQENKSVGISKIQFNCSDNDIDDDILSQLDVDAIASSYNR